MIKISVVKSDEADQGKIRLFKSENWGPSHDTMESHRLNFFRPNDYYVLAHIQNKLVGSIGLQIRLDCRIDESPAMIGMIGGVVVHKDHRLQGIALMMLKHAMAKFVSEKVEIAMLCTDIEKLAKLYNKVGFNVLGKPYYFFNLDGLLSEDRDGMVANVSNKQIYTLAIKPESVINIGASDA